MYLGRESFVRETLLERCPILPVNLALTTPEASEYPFVTFFFITLV